MGRFMVFLVAWAITFAICLAVSAFVHLGLILPLLVSVVAGLVTMAIVGGGGARQATVSEQLGGGGVPAGAANAGGARADLIMGAQQGPQLSSELTRLAELHRSGALSDVEFAAAKDRLINSPATMVATPTRWEYRDLAVPMNFKAFCGNPATPDEVVEHGRQKGNAIILAALERASREGWQPEGPTDFGSLLYRGAVNYRVPSFFTGLFHQRVPIHSATLRLKRPAV